MKYLIKLSSFIALMMTFKSYAAENSTVNSFSANSILSEATPTVKIVVVILLLASISTWAIFLFKLVELKRARQKLDQANERFQLANSLDNVVELEDIAAIHLLDAAQREVSQSGDILRYREPSDVQERISLMLHQREQFIIQQLGKGVSYFALVSSVTPFIGLFGTVWGIMHSFIGIAAANSTNIAVVAPGIAEALFATAIGLGVAIPATVMHNVTGKVMQLYRNQLHECSVLIVCLASRDGDRRRLKN